MRSPLCLSSRFRRNQDPLSIALTLLLLAGCGGGDGIILPNEGEPAAIEVVDGGDQRGLVGEPLADPLVVEVTDTRGRPVSGATVAFEFNSAGAGASVVPGQKITDADGRAATTLVLGTSIGRQTGQARVVQTGTPAILAPFSAMALPENANTMAAVAGQDQTGHVGQELDDRLVVEVTDNFGNPVAGVVINWAATGGGSISGAEVATDEDGRSRVDRILGPAVGQQTTVASAEGLAGSPVTFTHTALAGDASRLSIISGNDQTAAAGTLLPADLVVQLIDAEGNGVPGTAVSWVMATGGGSAGPEITTTDGEGRTSSRWTLGATLGSQRLDAVVSGVGIASFRATATAGAPASLFIRTQPSGSARNGVPLDRQPVIQLRDSQGNDVSQAGVQITVAIGSGGGELGGDRQMTTDASGRATFTNLSISGDPGPRTLIFTAPGYAQVTSGEIVLEAIGTSTTITGDSPDPSGVNAPFTVSFQVTSQGPTPTGSVTVSDGLQSCSGPLANGAGSCQLALTTVGTRTLTATYAGEPGLLGSSATEPHTVATAPPPPPVNQAPTADFAVTCNELDCQFEDRSTDPDGSIDGRQWSFGDGATSDRRDPGHDFASGGTYTVSLTVTDNDGATTVVTKDVTVSQSAASTSTRFEVDNPDPTIPGQPFTVTLSVRSGRGTPEGTATVTDGVDSCNVPIVGGSGSCSLVLNTVGDRRLTATYQGNASFATSSANESHRVNPAPPATTTTTITGDAADPSPSGQAITVTFTVTSSSGSPDGTVQVTSNNGGGSCNETVAQGSCSLTPANGTTTITAAYQGSSSFAGSSDTEPHTVSPPPAAATTTTITSDTPDPSDPDQFFTVEFTVTSASGTPAGRVTVSDGVENCSAEFAGGSGSCSLALTTSGLRTLTATYEGNSSSQGSSDTEDHMVTTPPPPNQAPTALDDTAFTDAGVGVNIDVSVNDTDPENTTLTIEIVDEPENGATVNNGDGTVTYTPEPNFSGTDVFTYSASDGSLSDGATVTVTVDPAPAP